MSHFGRYIFISLCDVVGYAALVGVSNSIKLPFFSCDLYLQLSMNGTQQFMKYRCARAMNVLQIKNAPLTIVNVRCSYYFIYDADTNSITSKHTNVQSVSYILQLVCLMIAFIYGNRIQFSIRFQLHTRRMNGKKAATQIAHMVTENVTLLHHTMCACFFVMLLLKFNVA